MLRYILPLALLLGTAAQAQVRLDLDTPERNAVATLGPCSGTLISPSVVMIVAHCLSVKARAKMPFNGERAPCKGMESQAKLARNPWEDPFRWYQLRNRQTLQFGVLRAGKHELTRSAGSYAIAHCADLALVRLTKPVPRNVARPMAVVIEPEIADILQLDTSILRYSGWGALTLKQAPRSHRATGDAALVSANKCHLFALPPMRVNGARILPGDSGSPLIYRDKTGREAVIGVLYGANVLDYQTCGIPSPRPPAKHGTYTYTWRPAIGETGSTDIGRWLKLMVRGLTPYTP